MVKSEKNIFYYCNDYYFIMSIYLLVCMTLSVALVTFRLTICLLFLAPLYTFIKLLYFYFCKKVGGES